MALAPCQELTDCQCNALRAMPKTRSQAAAAEAEPQQQATHHHHQQQKLETPPDPITELDATPDVPKPSMAGILNLAWT